MLSISEYIIQFMEKRKLSRNRLAEVLGYKSKTSIDRIINGTVRLESVQQFRDALEQAYHLSHEEKTQLNEAIAVFELGADKYLAIREIWDFIGGRHETDVSQKLCIMDSQTKQRIELLDRYKHVSNVHLTIVNCQYVGGLFGIIAQLLRTGCVLADHFIYVNDEDARTAKAISTLLSVFNEKGYMGYVRREKQNDEGSHECGLIDSDLMAVSWETVDGKKRSDLILFPKPERGVLLEIPYMDESTLAMIGFDKEKYSPFKRNYFECSAFEDYIGYSENYAALEKNRAVWKIKPDIGADQIPAGILKKAVQEGPAPQEPGFGDVLDILERIYQKRYENTCTKRKHAYTVYKRSAMHRFAKTGRTTDHFWMMRPYTPEERITILTELLFQQENNPYVHIYFLKENSIIKDVEIACYDDECILILEADTDYNLQQGHSEIMVRHQKMLKIYKEFFMNVLLRNYVYPEKETCNFLRQLIAEIRQLKNAGLDA